jgi:hypothetical protein
MADEPTAASPSTTEAAKAVAQTQEGALPPEPEEVDPWAPCLGEGQHFTVGQGVRGAFYAKPYERRRSDPVYRPLRIYTIDPSARRSEGAIAVVNVPYEPLEAGPKGRVFEVDNRDGWHDLEYRRVELDDPRVLITSGREPSPSDPMFHQQMVYAVCSLVYAAFRTALGRNVAWAFRAPGRGWPDGVARLRIRPHACQDENAYYDKERGELAFGYFNARADAAGRNAPGAFVFTCLSHDVVAHEVTHALLDGLRAEFEKPTGLDVPAFHEAFADIVAVFQHFSYAEVLKGALARSRGDIRKATLLTDLARQFGHTASGGSDRPLRTAIDVSGDADAPPRRIDPWTTEPHERGSVLLSAVFDAFVTVFNKKVERPIRLATNGSGVLPAGALNEDLQATLAHEASKLASQFLTICIRAIDYCPPIDIEFGEFLRAVLTADRELVPDDPWGYREAWIDAFRRRGIFAPKVNSVSEDALLWRPPARPVPPIPELTFAMLQFEGDPARPAGPTELHRQACALGRIVSQPQLLDIFGFVAPDDPRCGRDTVDPPCVQSIRTARRVGPDGQVLFDLVAEVTQRRVVRPQSEAEFDFFGGATVIIDPSGEIRYVISKRVLNEERLAQQRSYMADAGRAFWGLQNGRREPSENLFKLIHR